MQATSSTPTTGRIERDGGKVVGLWWFVKGGGFAAKVPALGGEWQAATLLELVGKIEQAWNEREAMLKARREAARLAAQVKRPGTTRNIKRI